MGQTNQTGMGDMGSGWVGGWVDGYMRAGLGVVVAGCGQVWADMGKVGQRRAGLDGSA